MASRPALAPTDRIIRSADAVRALFAGMADAAEERCGFAYLDPEWRLLGTRESTVGTATSAPVPLRDVIGDVLRLDAAALAMAHNHPAGDPCPSAADLAATRRLMVVLEALEVRLVDHLVLAGDRFVSMRELGLV